MIPQITETETSQDSLFSKIKIEKGLGGGLCYCELYITLNDTYSLKIVEMFFVICYVANICNVPCAIQKNILYKSESCEFHIHI